MEGLVSPFFLLQHRIHLAVSSVLATHQRAEYLRGLDHTSLCHLLLLHRRCEGGFPALFWWKRCIWRSQRQGSGWATGFGAGRIAVQTSCWIAWSEGISQFIGKGLEWPFMFVRSLYLQLHLVCVMKWQTLGRLEPQHHDYWQSPCSGLNRQVERPAGRTSASVRLSLLSCPYKSIPFKRKDESSHGIAAWWCQRNARLNALCNWCFFDEWKMIAQKIVLCTRRFWQSNLCPFTTTNTWLGREASVQRHDRMK